MDLKLDSEAMQMMLQKIIVDSLGAVGQEALMKEMVRYMTTETTGYNGQKSNSPLMGSLRSACETAATRYIQNKFDTDPEWQKAIDEMYAEGVKRFFQGEAREKAIANIAERMASAFSRDRY